MKNKLVRSVKRCGYCGKIIEKGVFCQSCCESHSRITIIDLYNMIANGEELPIRFVYDYEDWIKCDDTDDYYCESKQIKFSTYVGMSRFNDKIQVVEKECKTGTKTLETLRLHNNYGGTFEDEQEFRNKRDDEITKKN